MNFTEFFQGKAQKALIQAIDFALEEDGQDLTSRALFPLEEHLKMQLVAKEATLIAGLPISQLVFARMKPKVEIKSEFFLNDGQTAKPGQVLAKFSGPAAILLGAERTILNFICHLSGIANLTSEFSTKLKGSRTKVLDTRKTLPGLRYPEKYAVLVGGGKNHRMDLQEMLMLKDNHIDRAGSIAKGVKILRETYSPCPPIEVECRNLDEVKQAAKCNVQRIMLDNMDPDEIRKCLELIPDGTETEISGGVHLKSIEQFAELGADFISVGYLTHSAKYADLSMKIKE